MKESIWAYFMISFGMLVIIFIFFFQRVTNTDQQNFTLLRETTEAAMYDAVDMAVYHTQHVIRIDQEKFLDSFFRRFADNASLSKTYKIDIYDINEEPPKVSLSVSSTENLSGSDNQVLDFKLDNRIDAIIESK